jgi:diketogulonate reductase-like aldo/keto reductase
VNSVPLRQQNVQGCIVLEYKALSEGVKIPVLGIGTWGVGGKHVPDYSHDGKGIEAIRAAIDLGMTHIDTAEYYGAGHAEEIVGEAIKPYKRSDLFITTKVYRTHLRFAEVLLSLRNSLKRLATDYVDLFLIHWPDSQVPIKETISALETCVDEGLARCIGVSNFSTPLFQKAQNQTKRHKLVANQVYYNLTRVNRTYFHGLKVSDLYSYCKANGIMLIAWSPLEEGKLGKPGFPVLDQMAEKYRKTQAQIALNWLLSQENIVAIPKASSIDHLEENAGAVGWKLVPSDIKELGESFL